MPENFSHNAEYLNRSKLESAMRDAAATIGFLGLIAFALLYFARTGTHTDLRGSLVFTEFFFFKQDAVLLLGSVLALTVARGKAADKIVSRLPTLPNVHPIAAALLLATICYSGHYLLLAGYDLTRDEQMANFDAAIFAAGHLVWQIPAAWQRLVPALNDMFMLPIGHNEAWVSAYLPINAAVRSVFGIFADPALASPFFVASGLLALWRITVILWPESRSALPVAMLLYAGSGQILITGMTAYAMSGHLALNLIWLWLFLADRRLSDLAALAVGFLATGLHQPLFHPLFAMPFVALLALRGDWRRTTLFAAGYVFISVFWLAWPIWVSNLGTTPPAGTGPAIDYFTRLATTIRSPSADAISLMSLNLLRFIAWQHILLLPLLALGIRSAWRGGALARALVVGLLLPIAIMLVLLPWQGLGWGYRYLHGVIGNCILLAVYGWESLAAEAGLRRRVVVLSSAASFLLLFPVQSIMAHKFYVPAARIDRWIATSKADIAIVDHQGVPFAQELVLNRPDLTNRPIRLAGNLLDPSDLAALCVSGERLLFVEPPQLQPVRAVLGLPPAAASLHVLRRAAQDAGCIVVDPGGAP